MKEFLQTQELENLHWCTFNPDNPTEFVAMNKKHLVFCQWEEGDPEFQYYVPKAPDSDFSGKDRARAFYTKTVFIPGTDSAVTGTVCGDILVWDKSLLIEGIGEQHEKRLIKVVTLNHDKVHSAINILNFHDDYLVVGNENGTIRFYDVFFKVVAWFEDLNLSTIKSISFSKTDPRPATQTPDDGEKAFSCADFLVADNSSMVCMLQSTIFEEIDPHKKQGLPIFQGLKSQVAALAIHPHDPILAIAGSEGYILLWNYIDK